VGWIGIGPLDNAGTNTGPFDGIPLIPGLAYGNPAASGANLRVAHEHIFFGDPSNWAAASANNIGFGGNSSLFTEKFRPDILQQYRPIAINLRDDILNDATALTPPPSKYHVCGPNCQTWANEVLRNYRLLEKILAEGKIPYVPGQLRGGKDLNGQTLREWQKKFQPNGGGGGAAGGEGSTGKNNSSRSSSGAGYRAPPPYIVGEPVTSSGSLLSMPSLVVSVPTGLI